MQQYSSDEALSKLKRSLEQEHGRPVTDEELSQTTKLLDLMAEIIVDYTLKEANRMGRLSDAPEGYHLYEEEGGACGICKQWVSGADSWYDKNGLKCTCCQLAIDKKIIPGSIIKNEDSFYTSIQLQVSFNIKPNVIRSWIKQGILKDRIIPEKDGKGTHLQIFLLKDNKSFLPPPKKLRVGGPVKETGPDGKQEYAFYPWYYFVDPKEHLKKYGISHYFKIVPLENK